MAKDIDRTKRLEEAAKPLIRLLNEEYHPHVTVIVTPTRAEILEGVCVTRKIEDFIKD